MKFLKRITTLLLALFMVCGTATAASTEVYGLSDAYADRLSLITYLDIADSMAQSEAQETAVLRGEFAINVARMLNLSIGNDVTERYFTDVPNDHWAVGEINALVKLNIISVGDDKLFRPDDEITQPEALKMVLSACGYGDWATFNGGYPYGYTKAARMTKMSDYSADKAITFEKAVDLIYEGLTVPMYDMTKFGDEIMYETSSDNLLSMYHNLYTGEGTVTYADGISIDGGVNEESGYVRLDGETYKTNVSLLSYIGQTRSFVYTKDKNTDTNKEIVIVNSQNSDDDILKIAKDDFAEYDPDNNTVSYYSGDKLQTVKLSNSLIAVKNGKEYRNNSAEAFELNKGTITLIDADGKNGYDYAIVFEYKNYVIDRIDSQNKIVYDRTAYSNSLDLDDDNDDRRVIIEKGGRRVEFSAIAEGDVVTAYESDVFVRAVVTSNQITGTLYSIGNDSYGRYKLSIGKVKSDASDYIVDADYFANTIKDSASFPMGASATYYLDAANRIAYIEYGTGLPWQIAYLMNYSAETFFGTTVKLKLLLQSGTMGTYQVADKVTIDGVTIKDGSKVLSNLDKSRYTKTIAEGEDKIKGQLVRVKIDGEDKISAIDTEYSDSQVEGSQNLKRTAELQSLYYRYYPQSFDGKFLKNANTICFVVPTYASMDDSEDSDYRVISASSSYFWNKTHLIEGFKLDQSGGAEDAIVVYSDAGASTYGSFCLVESVNETMNADGELCKSLHVWSGGVEYDYVCDADYDLDVEVTENGSTKTYSIDSGDIVKLAKDMDNLVMGAKLYYDYSRRNDADYNYALGALDTNYYTDQGNIFYMYIKSIKNNVMALSTTKPTEEEYKTNPQKADFVTTISGSTVMIYDKNARSNKVYSGSLSDVIPADKAGKDAQPYFILANKGLAIGAIIYK